MSDCCKLCGKEKPEPDPFSFVQTPNGWWVLNGYYGFTGLFCPDCYHKVRHNSDREPDDPDGFAEAVAELLI